MNEETTLADLLQLNLHQFEDEVREIVDKSVKEMGMEKVNGCVAMRFMMDENVRGRFYNKQTRYDYCHCAYFNYFISSKLS